MQRLSQQRTLDSLWNLLSECLQVCCLVLILMFFFFRQIYSLRLGILFCTCLRNEEEREKHSRREETCESQLLHLIGKILYRRARFPIDGGSLTMTIVLISSQSSDFPPDIRKFLSFAERHRTVLHHRYAP